jgi:hypothetical protein
MYRLLEFRCHTRITSLVFLGALVVAAGTGNGESKKPNEESPAKETKVGELPVEVRFTDNSVLKLSLREEHVELTTPYGKLSIPVSEIRRIEFGLRIPDDVSRKIESAISELGNSQYRRRETATAILLGLREKAYPAVLNATKHSDMEIANRAEELVKKFKETVPAELLQVRDYDVVHTDLSRIAGRIEPSTLKAHTTQFGDVTLRLADVFVMSAKGAELENDGSAVAVAPVNLVQFQNEIGKSFTFKVTGSSGGSVWGTDVYTTDTTLATAAVHAGLLTVGQTGTIRVTIVPSPPAFTGSTRNGVTSTDYGQYPAAFRMRR